MSSFVRIACNSAELAVATVTQKHSSLQNKRLDGRKGTAGPALIALISQDITAFPSSRLRGLAGAIFVEYRGSNNTRKSGDRFATSLDESRGNSSGCDTPLSGLRYRKARTIPPARLSGQPSYWDGRSSTSVPTSEVKPGCFTARWGLPVRAMPR